MTKDDIGRERQQFLRIFAHEANVTLGPTDVDACSGAFGPAQCFEPIKNGLQSDCIGGGFHRAHQYRYPLHPFGLLSPHHERPRRGAAEHSDEHTPFQFDHLVEQSVRTAGIHLKVMSLPAQLESRTCTNEGAATPGSGVCNNLDSLTDRCLFNIAHISERERPLGVSCGLSCAPCGNTNAPAIVIAERAAKMIIVSK
jgi:hypothetical protein